MIYIFFNFNKSTLSKITFSGVTQLSDDKNVKKQDIFKTFVLFLLKIVNFFMKVL